jgi:Mg2+/Co2+ transporter CorB
MPVSLTFSLIGLCFILSAFFSSTETALMSINRYRLRTRARQGHRGAKLAEQLLSQPDRLIGVILLGNTLANTLAATLAALLTLETWGEEWLSVTAGALTFFMLVLCEVGPKTYGALHPERLAYPAAYVYRPLLTMLSPLVWVVNLFANALLRLLGLSARQVASHSLSADELRTVVAEAGAVIPLRHQQMLMSILDLESMTVDDVMVPRQDVAGIDLDDSWDDLLTQLRETRHTRLPVHTGGLDHITGVLHMKTVVHALARGELTRERLGELARAREACYVPEGTTLNQQLLNFQRDHQRMAFVVDEYGDVQGLITLEDILEEIVGEFTTSPTRLHRDIHQESPAVWVVAGSASLREINRALGWQFPTDGPKTLNGLILEYLETIPAPGTGLRLHGYPMEILQTQDNAVKTVRIRAARETATDPSSRLTG